MNIYREHERIVDAIVRGRLESGAPGAGVKVNLSL